MKKLILLLAFATASPLAAQIIAATSRGILVAQPNQLQLVDAKTNRTIWSGDGLPHPTALVTGATHAAIVDPLANEVMLVDLATGARRVAFTGETPVAGAFVGNDLFVVARDANEVERIRPDGTKASVRVAADPAFVRESRGRLLVYSRVAGVLQEVDPATMTIARRVDVAPFASDMEADSTNAYLVLPRPAKIAVIELDTFRQVSLMDAGAVPTDLAFTSGGSALSARTLALADPSAKRVWILQGAQSTAMAFARGFLRGLIGLGLFAPRNSDFPTGIDRVAVRGSKCVAYDTTSGTLYRYADGKPTTLATNIAPGAYTMTAEGVVVWDGGALKTIGL